MNSGNLVSRIGLARRRMWCAIFWMILMMGVAWMGWSRPMVQVIAERPIGISDCTEYAKVMCNN